jgi:hypothetical protein
VIAQGDIREPAPGKAPPKTANRRAAPTRASAAPATAAVGRRQATAIGPHPPDALAGLLRSAVAERAATPPGASTSPPSDAASQAAIARGEDVELTSPVDWFRPGWRRIFGGGAPPAPAAATVQRPVSLKIRSTGAIQGAFGIGDYWPGVTPYWGDDKQLGAFDELQGGGGHMIGHKFQVVGEYETGTTTAGTGGPVLFEQLARLTNAKGDPPGPWFNDMAYTDAYGGVHAWEPNVEAGLSGPTGNPGVRRTLSTTEIAYTDPPAIGYGDDTSTYRKLEFKIRLIAPPGSTRGDIATTAAQEIEVVDGTPNVIQAL